MDGNNIDSECFRYENANLNKGSNKQAFMDFSQKKIGEKLSAGSAVAPRHQSERMCWYKLAK